MNEKLPYCYLVAGGYPWEFRWCLGTTEMANRWVFFFAVLELELRAFTLSHSTSPGFFVKGFSS
jgi:hypothetical protein